MPAGLSRPWRRAQLALLAAGVAALLGAANDARATGATTTLTNDVVTNLNLATLLGPCRRVAACDRRRLLDQPEPGGRGRVPRSSSTTRRARTTSNFLDPDTFNQQFGVPAATFAGRAGLAAGRRAHGLDDRGRRRTTSLATGTAAQVAGRVRDDARTATRRNGRDASTRTRVAPSVPAVARRRRRCSASTTSTASSRRGVSGRRAAPVTARRRSARCRTPACSARRTSGRSTTCRRRTAATASRWRSSAGASPTPVDPDLRSFEAEWSLPQVPVTVKYYGDTSTPDTSDDGATGRVGARHAGVDRHGAERRRPRPSTSRTTTPTPTSSRRSPAG